MKKFILPLIAIVLLSSCSSKFSLQKRRYNKGFYFAGIKNHKTQPRSAEEHHAKSIATGNDLAEVEIAGILQTKETTKSAGQSSKTVSSAKATKKVSVPLAKPYVAAANPHAAQNVYASASEKSGALITVNKTRPLTFEKQKKGDSGARLIIEVILCFFWWLDLIAVYMHDGGITLNFWLTLLLDLLVIVGMVYALLVVLDIVDMK